LQLKQIFQFSEHSIQLRILQLEPLWVSSFAIHYFFRMTNKRQRGHHPL